MLLQKSQEVWNPAPYQDTHNTIVLGCGATGSWLLPQLARMGLCKNLHVFDFDSVELKNVNNQNFNRSDIGKYKVEAMYEKLLDINEDFEISQFHNEKFLYDTHKSYFNRPTVLYVCIDVGRQDLLNKVQYNPNVKCVIETRIGVDTGKVYIIQDKKDWANYLTSLPSEVEELTVREASPCGEALSIAPAIVLTASIAAQALRWYTDKNKKTKEAYFEIKDGFYLDVF